jgi:hypothetical protein
MDYASLRDFRTEDPAQLRTDLQRQNRALENAFADMEREAPRRLRVVKVVEDTYQAEFGDFVLAGFNQDAAILLPSSEPATAGLSVWVVQVGGAGGVTAVAQSGQLIDNAATYAIGVNTGHRQLVADGLGNFWGPAL